MKPLVNKPAQPLSLSSAPRNQPCRRPYQRAWRSACGSVLQVAWSAAGTAGPPAPPGSRRFSGRAPLEPPPAWPCPPPAAPLHFRTAPTPPAPAPLEVAVDLKQCEIKFVGDCRNTIHCKVADASALSKRSLIQHDIASECNAKQKQIYAVDKSRKVDATLINPLVRHSISGKGVPSNVCTLVRTSEYEVTAKHWGTRRIVFR